MGALIRKIQPQLMFSLSTPTGRRPDRQRQRRDGAPDAHGTGAFARVDERGPDQRQRVGVTSAAPTPCTTRAAISVSCEPASPAATEAAVNTARPVKNITRSPKTSASRPPASSSPAKAEDVAAHDPFEPGERQAQLALDRRQRHVDHVVVEIGHEGRQRHGRQHPPSAERISECPLVAIRRTCTAYMSQCIAQLVRRIVVKWHPRS